MWGRKPKGAGRRAIPPAEEIIATSMLLGEEAPIICSCCLGRRKSRGLFGVMSTCGQCEGWGFDYVGRKTCEALRLGIKYNSSHLMDVAIRKLSRSMHND